MGFYIRKALKVGPLRFNLSKSGIGVSAGIKGFRVGSGPRGNYVHMGRGGLYYRKTLPSGGSQQSPSSRIKPNQHTENLNHNLAHEPLKEIESGSVLNMVDSSSASLLEEMNNKRKKTRLWPFVAILGFIVTLIIHNATTQQWPVYISAIFFIGLTYFASLKDQLSKTTVLFFELEQEIESLYESLHSEFDQIAGCVKKWHVEAEGAVKDWKRTAGASSVVKRKGINFTKGSPPYVKTNISVPSIPVGKQALYFFPDKILVFEANGVGAVNYKQLNIEIESTRFIEDGTVPRDAKVVDRTWKYVNKKGGPDKRFKDNKELPIALYEDIIFTSSTGLNERIQVSRTGICKSFLNSIVALSKFSAA